MSNLPRLSEMLELTRRPVLPLGFALDRPAVVLGLPRKSLYVGSFLHVPVRLHKIAFEEVVFEVPEGAQAGLVSPSRDAYFNPQGPTFLLLVGYRPGTWRVVARHAVTGVVLGEAKFQSDALWRREEVGPPRWFTGQQRGYSAGAAWGGGPAGAQNINVVPATGTRRIAILLVDTSDQRYTSDAPTLQGFRDNWMNELINGVTDGAGVTRSARLFYREVSYNNFDLSASVFGPVSLPGTFDDYFNADGTPKGTFFQACFTAGDGLVNYSQFDTLLCVSQHADGPPQKSAWPYASIGNWGPYTTAEGDRNYGVISMPNAWEALDGRKVHETFCHELGHNLGLGDQYTPSVPGRNPGDWELMDADASWPHFSIAHRMMLGWVPEGWLQTFNFQSMAAPVDQTTTLSAIENGTPAAGRNVGLEVRLADGWNYYFEYRAGQVAQIGDRSLPTDSRVLGTDVVSSPYTPPILRPAILLLNNDIDGDGAVLGNIQDYEESDTTDPVYPTDFRVDVSGIDGTKADVRVRYGINSRPDPSIRPWPASADRQWQSPDIEVRNPRNAADSAWFNVPWGGNSNTVVAKVKNNGALDAPQVRVNFYVKDYNVGGTPETFLGSDVQDVPANSTIEFSTTWPAPASGHYCIIVRIPLYQLPANPAVVEMTELNNVAQSNYDRFISATTTPSREVSTIRVGNPYPVRTRIWIHAANKNPLYRTYLGNQWLWLDPGETRTVLVMYEFAPDLLESDVYPAALLPKLREFSRKPNRVAFTAFIENPRDDPRHSIDVLGGAESEVVTGKSTELRDVVVRDGRVTGTVVTKEDHQSVASGLVIVRTPPRKRGEAFDYQTIKVEGGRFSAAVGSAVLVRVYYLPGPGYADSEVEVNTKRTRTLPTRGTIR